MGESVTSKQQCAPGDHVYEWDQSKPGFSPCVFCGYEPLKLRVAGIDYETRGKYSPFPAFPRTGHQHQFNSDATGKMYPCVCGLTYSAWITGSEVTG